MTAPKRRWFRFTLGTMFGIVTVFGCFLGWELKFIHDRQNKILELERLGGAAVTVAEMDPENDRSADGLRIPTIPFWRRCLGDRAIYCIYFPYYFIDGSEEVRQVESLFPELEVGDFVWASGPGS